MTYFSAGHPQTSVNRPEHQRQEMLFASAALLGLIAYGVSFAMTGESASLAWSVRFAVLASLVAALGLSPKAGRFPVAVVALAGAGFFDALWFVVAGAGSGWAPTVIAVVTAAQTAAAVAALVSGNKPKDDGITGYEAYVDYYNEAVRSYYQQQPQGAAEPQQRAGYGQAHGNAVAHGESAQRPSQAAQYSELDYGARQAAAPAQHSAGPVAGMPSFGHAPASAEPNRHGREESAPPSAPA